MIYYLCRMKNNITGRWHFSEDFGFGKDKGFAVLEQQGDVVTGYVEFTESIEDEEPFGVRQHVEGTFDGSALDLKGIKIEMLEEDNHIEYHPDHWEGIMNVQGQLVGSSSDGFGTFGVFVMEKSDVSR